jgi:hypothetical protein
MKNTKPKPKQAKPGSGGVFFDRTKGGRKSVDILTYKQAETIKHYVKNKGKGGISQAMRDAGYKENTAKQPAMLTRNPVFKQALKEVLSAEMIIQCLNDDILAKPGNRVAELNLASKIRGLLIDKSEQLVKTINIDISEAIAKKNNLLPKKEINLLESPNSNQDESSDES